MKRSAATRLENKTLNKLLKDGIPRLKKANMSLQSSPHVFDTNHEPAAVSIEEISLQFPDHVCCVHDDHEQSFLLKDLGRRDAFEYQTESQIQNFVRQALGDATECLGLQDFLDIKPEISVFAYRPDIIAVSHSLRGIILVVAVKKPGGDVFHSHDVGGQVFDYLVGLLGSGIRPFCVLSTYDESCIAYLNDDGASKGIIEKTLASLDSYIPESHVFAQRETQLRARTDRSPPSKTKCVLTHIREDSDQGRKDPHVDAKDGGNSDASKDDPTCDREVMYTPTFSGRDAMKGLMLAIRCGLVSLNESDGRDNPAHGSSAVGSCALVNATGLFWTNLPSTIKFDYYTFPGRATSIFYLWKDLGKGIKGQVFLACNSAGKVCAAKFFLLDLPLLHRTEGASKARCLEWERQMTTRKQAADLECSRWTKAYKGIFRNSVRVVQLNGLWCLLMPHFDPVLEADRPSSLSAIESILLDFKKQGLRYADDDLRWRHVGMRDGEVFLFDLGSLEPNDTSKPGVGDQIRFLQDRM